MESLASKSATVLEAQLQRKQLGATVLPEKKEKSKAKSAMKNKPKIKLSSSAPLSRTHDSLRAVEQLRRKVSKKSQDHFKANINYILKDTALSNSTLMDKVLAKRQKKDTPKEESSDEEESLLFPNESKKKKKNRS